MAESMARDIREVLDKYEVPRSTMISNNPPRFTYGYGLSIQSAGQVCVWANPGGIRADDWDQSVRLARRIEQVLTLAGFVVYRDALRDPQQVIVIRDVRDPRARTYSRASKVASLLGLAFCGLAFITNGPGFLLLALLSLIVAVILGRAHDRHARPKQIGEQS